MAVPFDKPMVCPIMVGRTPSLAALDAYLDAACIGQGGAVFLAGEAGVGKSRLVIEARAHAAARGMAILDTRCFEPDRALPYAPLLDVLRTHVAGHPSDSVMREVAATTPELVWLLPELARFRPDPIVASAQDSLRDQRRLALAFVQLIEHLAATQAVLLVIEDLHWSDDASLDVLLRLARRLATQPLVLLLTYRNDEINASLRHTLALFDRERLSSDIVLSRLTLSEVDAMLRAIFAQPQPIRADFLQAIYDLTDGNPFFVEEVVRSLVAAGDIFRAGMRWERRALAQLQIPRSIHDAVLRRLQYLSLDAARVLRLAAVAGRFFDVAIIQTLTGYDDNRLLDLIRELVAAQLVVEESADRFAFRHALTRQAVYLEMLSRERRALHRTIAETIERVRYENLEPHLADLSAHFTVAEAWEKAMEYGERAGAHALQLFAPGAAVEHLTRALEAATRLSLAPPPRLRRERGRALALVGDFDGALQDYQAVQELARVNGDRLAEWQALIDLGDVWSGYDYDRAGQHFEQALDLARALDSPEAEAESLTHLGSWHLNNERTDEAEQCLQSALVSFELAGDRRAVARTIDLLGTVSDIAGDVARMRQRYEQAATLFRESGDRRVLSSTLATMCLQSGADVFATVVTPSHISPDQTMAEAEEALSLARSVGWRAGEAYALLCLSIGLIWRGHYGTVVDLVRDGLAIAQEIDHREWMALGHAGHGLIFRDLLHWARAREHLAHAHTLARGSGSLYWLHVTAGYLAEVLVMGGEIDEATTLLSTIAPNLPMRTLGQRRIWTARARLALAQADPNHALDIVDRLYASAIGLIAMQDIPLLALLRGQALAVLDRHEEAEEALGAALRGANDRDARPLCWRIHLALGQTYAACGRATDASQALRSAREIVADVAATLPGDLHDGFLSRVAALLPVDRSRAIQERGTVLTERERDVATLVAQGLSNRDIGRALYIGERTVETHVGNLLSKLGYTSRTQIAAWAIESGLSRSME